MLARWAPGYSPARTPRLQHVLDRRCHLDLLADQVDRRLLLSLALDQEYVRAFCTAMATWLAIDCNKSAS